MIHTIDFETEAIGLWPEYPPKPVGVSIWYSIADKPIYLAWGHPSENNCTFEEARKKLGEIWHDQLLFHNARFDTEVARVHMGLPYPSDPTRIHDTMFLLYLQDPQADTLSLKPSPHRILGLPPEEQEALRKYLASKGYTGNQWGAHISKAPGGIVGTYAEGDVYRTRKLYEHLMPIVNQNGMLAAYRREQRLAPILNQNEADGIRINLDKLEKDFHDYTKVQIKVTGQLREIIGNCNPDSPSELAHALIKSGVAQESDFKRTPTGKLSTAKGSIESAVKDPTVKQLLAYRGQLKTLLTTFMKPWLELGQVNGGVLHPQFNQVRGDEYGTRTGRLSSSNPNFQNVPTEPKGTSPDGYPALPYMREYVLPDPGHVLVSADFHSQEFRIAAHYAEGRAAEIYRTDPAADFHAEVAKILESDAGLTLPRKAVKITGFSLIYGSGVRALAELLKVDQGTAAKIRKHYFEALPGLRELMDDVSARGHRGQPVRTWGGRLIHAEKGKLVNGQMWTFEYKLLNYLIQGSAADQTKEAIITAGYRTENRRFLATVHDENVYSIDPAVLRMEVTEIREAMENQSNWDIPWRVEMKKGPNWHNLEKYDYQI